MIFQRQWVAHISLQYAAYTPMRARYSKQQIELCVKYMDTSSSSSSDASDIWRVSLGVCFYRWCRVCCMRRRCRSSTVRGIVGGRHTALRRGLHTLRTHTISQKDRREVDRCVMTAADKRNRLRLIRRAMRVFLSLSPSHKRQKAVSWYENRLRLTVFGHWVRVHMENETIMKNCRIGAEYFAEVSYRKTLQLLGTFAISSSRSKQKDHLGQIFGVLVAYRRAMMKWNDWMAGSARRRAIFETVDAFIRERQRCAAWRIIAVLRSRVFKRKRHFKMALWKDGGRHAQEILRVLRRQVDRREKEKEVYVGMTVHLEQRRIRSAIRCLICNVANLKKYRKISLWAQAKHDTLQLLQLVRKLRLLGEGQRRQAAALQLAERHCARVRYSHCMRWWVTLPFRREDAEIRGKNGRAIARKYVQSRGFRKGLACLLSTVVRRKRETTNTDSMLMGTLLISRGFRLLASSLDRWVSATRMRDLSRRLLAAGARYHWRRRVTIAIRLLRWECSKSGKLRWQALMARHHCEQRRLRRATRTLSYVTHTHSFQRQQLYRGVWLWKYWREAVAIRWWKSKTNRCREKRDSLRLAWGLHNSCLARDSIRRWIRHACSPIGGSAIVRMGGVHRQFSLSRIENVVRRCAAKWLARTRNNRRPIRVRRQTPPTIRTGMSLVHAPPRVPPSDVFDDILLPPTRRFEVPTYRNRGTSLSAGHLNSLNCCDREDMSILAAVDDLDNAACEIYSRALMSEKQEKASGICNDAMRKKQLAQSLLEYAEMLEKLQHAYSKRMDV